jgi:hypothetical protein
MARFDALDADPQAEPPDREFAQVEQSVRGSERHTVVAADVGWQAASRRATNCNLSSMTEHSFQGIASSP